MQGKTLLTGDKKSVGAVLSRSAALSCQVGLRKLNSLSGKKPTGLNAVEMVISVEPSLRLRLP